jgi:hypothetical protein
VSPLDLGESSTAHDKTQDELLLFLSSVIQAGPSLHSIYYLHDRHCDYNEFSVVLKSIDSPENSVVIDEDYSITAADMTERARELNESRLTPPFSSSSAARFSACKSRRSSITTTWLNSEASGVVKQEQTVTCFRPRSRRL